MPRLLPYPVVSRCVAALLLLAAALKVNGLAVSAIGGSGVFASAGFQVAVVELEILLAAWLLWGGYPLAGWLATLGVFMIFAGVSGWQGWVGRASCGCFGQVTVSPWWAFLLDVAVLVALLLARPRLGQRRPVPTLRGTVPVACGFLAVVVATAAVAGAAALKFGSVDAALSALRGERISLYPKTVDVGTGEQGEERIVGVEVVNHTSNPIRLIGGTRD